MKRDVKFNYGILFVGLALPIVSDYFLGKACGIVVAIVVGVLGVFFLVSGHAHRESGDAPLSRRGRMAVFAITGAVIALALFGLRAVYNREVAKVAPSIPSQSDKKANEQEPETKQEPPKVAPLPKAIPPQRASASKANTVPNAATQQTSGDKLPAQNCPNGICIGGNNSGNASVYNYGPPPIQMKWTIHSIDPPQPTQSGKAFKYEQQVTVTVDQMYTPVSLGVVCSAPISEIEGWLPSAHTQFLPKNGTDKDDQKKGFVYWQGSPATPQDPVIIAIWSDEPLSVLKVATTQIIDAHN